MQNKKINWWALIAIIVIGVPVGFVGTGFFNRHKTVSAPQDSLYLTISEDNINLQSGEGKVSFEINSNTDWSISVENESEWLSIAPLNGKGEGTVYLTVAKNDSDIERSTSIIVLWNGNNEEKFEQRILVTQEPGEDPDPLPDPVPIPPTISLSVSPNNVAFATNGGTRSINIRSNTEWEVTVVNGKEWLTTDRASGNNNGTITLKAAENMDVSRRSATVKISWFDDNKTIRNSIVNVAQEGKKEPKPDPNPIVHLSKEEAQSIVSNGLADDRVPDNCRISVNGINTTYSRFRQDVTQNKYTSVQIMSLTTNKTTGKAATINVKVTTKQPDTISKSEVQAIVSAGKTDTRIPDDCKMVGNGIKTSYKQFRTNVLENRYESVTVESVTSDKKGNVSQIKVKVVRPAPPDPDPIPKDEIKKIVASGQKSSKVPETCIIVINKSKSKQYKKFRDGLDFGYYSNVEVINVEYDKKKIPTKIYVKATENVGE